MLPGEKSASDRTVGSAPQRWKGTSLPLSLCTSIDTAVVNGRRYEDPTPDRAGLESPDPVVVSSALVGFALHGDHRRELEFLCRRFATHVDQGVRDTAGLCIGHIGRRFGEVGDDTYAVLLKLVQATDSDGRPSDGLGDVRQFAGR